MTKEDNLEDFLEVFKRTDIAGQCSCKTWVLRLGTLLVGEALAVHCTCLEKQDYEHVKQAIISHLEKKPSN